MKHRLLLGMAAATGVIAAAVAVVYYKDISLIGPPRDKAQFDPEAETAVDPTVPRRRISSVLGKFLRLPRY
jgi:hypothetical protein